MMAPKHAKNGNNDADSRQGMAFFEPYAHVAPGSIHVLMFEDRRRRWICQVCGNLVKAPAPSTLGHIEELAP